MKKNEIKMEEEKWTALQQKGKLVFPLENKFSVPQTFTQTNGLEQAECGKENSENGSDE
jgi:hypothetical protein